MSNKNNIVRILAVIIVVFSLIMITNYKNVQNYFNLYLVIVLFISILIVYMFSFSDEVKQSFDDIEILKEISKTTTGQYLEMSKLFNADLNKVSIELRPNLTIYMINEDYKLLFGMIELVIIMLYYLGLLKKVMIINSFVLLLVMNIIVQVLPK